MNVGDLVNINLEKTNLWLSKTLWNDDLYWTYPVREVGEIDGRPVYMRETSPTLIPRRSMGIVMAHEDMPARNPVVVMINGGLYAFGPSELIVVRRA